MTFLDTHCHISDDRLYRQSDAVIERAKAAGCLACYNNADCLESFDRILELKHRYPGFCHAALGIHPEFAAKDDAYQEAAFAYVIAHLDEVDAIGEIGLDYHYDKSEETVSRQKDIFRRWLRFAKEVHLPVVIHARDASQDTFDIIREELPERVDLHCYSGSYELLKEYLKLPIQFYIGVGGVVTFRNSRVLTEVVTKGPLSCLMTETDSPYLAPSPHRGETNEPGLIPLVIEKIAELKGLTVEEVSRTLLRNGETFYGKH